MSHILNYRINLYDFKIRCRILQPLIYFWTFAEECNTAKSTENPKKFRARWIRIFFKEDKAELRNRKLL
ncbi:hypothetical protein LEP1GSC169_1817 [Leptospira santarosai str. HAI1349]|nr:hypothetical protein LEP1GSC169_1817 [Leptospira santarosai str. HAI1349]